MKAKQSKKTQKVLHFFRGLCFMENRKRFKKVSSIQIIKCYHSPVSLSLNCITSLCSYNPQTWKFRRCSMHSKLTFDFLFPSLVIIWMLFWIIQLRSYRENKNSKGLKMSLLGIWGYGQVYKILCPSEQRNVR